jgi:hypothetical protein
MPGENLVAAFVGDYRFKREISRIGVALKRLSIDGQQIDPLRATAGILGTAGLAVYMAVFDLAHETSGSRNELDSLLAGEKLRRGNSP